MYRYIGLVWDSASETAAAGARLLAMKIQSLSTPWTCSLDIDGVVLFHTGDRPRASTTRVLKPSSGAVFGTLFTKPDAAGSTCAAHLDSNASSRIVASGGKLLVHSYWGRYVAILHSANTTWVVRDPSGMLPCFFTTHAGVRIFFSSIEDCLRLGLKKFSINWDYVVASAAFSPPDVRETGLKEISEVQPGECIRISGNQITSLTYWEASRVATASAIESQSAASAALRVMTRACIQTWAGCYDGILHKLSGGLDSSIVLSCLRDAPNHPSLTCLNYFSEGAAEDERRYARISAEHADVPLVERQRNPRGVRLESVLTMAPSPKPRSCLSELQRGRFEEEFARENGIGAVFSGGGGDALFYQARAVLATADFLATRGVAPGLFGAALDAARVERISVWSVLVQSVRRRVGGARMSLRLEKPRLRDAVRADAVEILGDYNRWRSSRLIDTAGLPPGKYWHVQSLSSPPGFYNPFGQPNDPEMICPLISQPLVELCLQIPTYTLIAGGWDRSVARQAFAADVPSEILHRRAKGATDDYILRIVEHNREFVRSFLLDGLLVKHGILDEKAIEQHLGIDGALRTAGYIDIVVEHLSTEAWVRMWHAAVDQRAAA